VNSWGYEDLLLLVEAANVPAVSLYKKMGFKEVFRDEDAKASQVQG
jgi:ribosomal protein S18 acetylase RimI-like enzyme